MSNALVIITDGFEELETIAPVDIMRRAGIEVTLASITHDLEVKGRNGIRLVADAHFETVQEETFDALVIPGGPGHKLMLNDEKLIEFLQLKAKSGILIASICAGPIVLQKAGLLNGKAYTSHHSTVDSLSERLEDKSVVMDGKLITSQGAGTSLEFALAIVEHLCSAEISEEIARDIAFQAELPVA